MSSQDKLRVLALEKLVKSSLKNLSALCDKSLFNIYHVQHIHTPELPLETRGGQSSAERHFCLASSLALSCFHHCLTDCPEGIPSVSCTRILDSDSASSEHALRAFTTQNTDGWFLTSVHHTPPTILILLLNTEFTFLHQQIARCRKMCFLSSSCSIREGMTSLDSSICTIT